MEQLSPYLQNPLVVMCLYFLGTGLFLVLFHFFHKWIWHQIKRTSNMLDDILIESSYLPLMFMILALGISSALAVLGASFPFVGAFVTGSQIPYMANSHHQCNTSFLGWDYIIPSKKNYYEVSQCIKSIIPPFQRKKDI